MCDILYLSVPGLNVKWCTYTTLSGFTEYTCCTIAVMETRVILAKLKKSFPRQLNQLFDYNNWNPLKLFCSVLYALWYNAVFITCLNIVGMLSKPDNLKQHFCWLKKYRSKFVLNLKMSDMIHRKTFKYFTWRWKVFLRCVIIGL